MHICVKYPMMINLKTFLNTLLEKYKKMKFLYDVTTRVRKIFYGLKSLNVCFSKIYQHKLFVYYRLFSNGKCPILMVFIFTELQRHQ